MAKKQEVAGKMKPKKDPWAWAKNLRAMNKKAEYLPSSVHHPSFKKLPKGGKDTRDAFMKKLDDMKADSVKYR